jgi:hypothetical protein
VAPLESATVLKEHLQSWQQVTLPGVGHLLPEEAPDACASLIAAWLLELNAEETAPPRQPAQPSINSHSVAEN